MTNISKYHSVKSDKCRDGIYRVVGACRSTGYGKK